MAATVASVHLSILKMYQGKISLLWKHIFHETIHVNRYHSLGYFSRRRNDYIFSYFFQKTGFDISCKLSLLETICIKYQNLFSEKNKKNILKCRLLKSLLKMLSALWDASSEKVPPNMLKLRIQVILRMRKVPSGHLLSVHAFFSIQRIC